jgi:antitoxin YefM
MVIIIFLYKEAPMQIDSYIPVTKAKTKLLDIIRIINDREDTIAITKNGIPRAVVMSMEQYESMRETMAILGDKEMMEQIRHSGNEINKGKPLINLEDLL